MTQPTREHGETARTPRETLPPAEFEHAPNTEQWMVGTYVKVIACPHGDKLVSLGVGIDGTELTAPQVRGLILCLQAAYARAWPDRERG